MKIFFENRMLNKLLDVPEDSLNKTLRRQRIVESDVIRDGVEPLESGSGPDYFSHRAMRFFAPAWVTTRSSSIARSPRSMPPEC
ncbi:MAG: hypothetical protein JWM99_700 [Verrucomicrobiales bacterium]|nr:hypothetical protein [Verrucomicrobiales bacterium]